MFTPLNGTFRASGINDETNNINENNIIQNPRKQAAYQFPICKPGGSVRKVG